MDITMTIELTIQTDKIDKYRNFDRALKIDVVERAERNGVKIIHSSRTSEWQLPQVDFDKSYVKNRA